MLTNQKNAELNHLKGVTLFKLDKVDEAIEAMKKAVELDAENELYPKELDILEKVPPPPPPPAPLLLGSRLLLADCRLLQACPESHPAAGAPTPAASAAGDSLPWLLRAGQERRARH